MGESVDTVDVLNEDEYFFFRDSIVPTFSKRDLKGLLSSGLIVALRFKTWLSRLPCLSK